MPNLWHITGPVLHDGTPLPRDGRWLRLPEGESGYHACARVVDCLDNATGTIICAVELDGDLGERDGKRCGSGWRILWRIDDATGEQLLRHFARWCAWRVRCMWEMPEVVRQYLLTGDESIRAAAAAACATAAALDATWDATWAAQNDALTRAVVAAHEGRDWRAEMPIEEEGRPDVDV